MEDKIKEVLAAVLDIPKEQIDENSSPEVHENWDSLRHMNLVVALEEEFEIDFNDDQIVAMKSFKDIINIVHVALN